MRSTGGNDSGLLPYKITNVLVCFLPGLWTWSNGFLQKNKYKCERILPRISHGVKVSYGVIYHRIAMYMLNRASIKNDTILYFYVCHFFHNISSICHTYLYLNNFRRTDCCETRKLFCRVSHMKPWAEDSKFYFEIKHLC